MDWCCLAGLLAGGVPPGRIRIWGILISLHLFSLSGTHFVGGGNGVPFLGDTLAWAGLREGEALGVSEGRLPFSRLPLLATQLFCVLVGVGLLAG